MKRDEILGMPAGRELDFLVHSRVMVAEEKSAIDPFDGHPVGLPHYSTDIASAWEVVCELSKNCKTFTLIFDSRMIDARLDKPIRWLAEFDKFEAYADTPSLAICRAALAAVLKDGK